MLVTQSFQVNNQILQKDKAISFGRSLTADESRQLKTLVNDAYESLGVKQRALIIHAPSLPALPSENTGIGVWGALEGTKRAIDFAATNGFNSIIMEPPGIVSKGDKYSPYSGTILSKKMVADLSQLTTSKWAEILTKNDVKQIVENNPHKGNRNRTDRANFDYALSCHQKALEKAYTNFDVKVRNQDQKALEILGKFNDFKVQKGEDLTKDAIFEILVNKEYNRQDYPANWKGKHSEIDKNLFNPDYPDQEALEARKQQILSENQTDVETYKFSQFIVNETQKDIIEYANNKGVKPIGDRQVGYSHRDVWGNPDIFTKGAYMGCPPDYFAEEGQAWGFKFLDYDKLFKPDGSLDKAGLYLESLYERMLEDNPGGIRIDHTVGLIDSWEYPEGKKATEGHRVMFAKLLDTDLKELKNCGITLETIKGVDDPWGAIENKEENKIKGLTSDQRDRASEILLKNKDKVMKKYAAILEKIVIPAAMKVEAERSGKDLSNPAQRKELEKTVREQLICEDLGVLTVPVIHTMKKLDLNGIRHARYADPNKPDDVYREINPKEAGNYFTVGTHDDGSYKLHVKSLKKEDRIAQAKYLVDELLTGKPEQKKADYLSRLMKKTNEFVTAKFARLMAGDKHAETPNRLMVMWTDLLGNDKRYNQPGESENENWTLRMRTFFDKTYYNRTLPNNKGINIPETLAIAMRAMGDKFTNQNESIISELDRFAGILKEKPVKN